MHRGTESGDARLGLGEDLNEKRRTTPKRWRVIDPFNDGHVMECGSALPL